MNFRIKMRSHARAMVHPRVLDAMMVCTPWLPTGMTG
jgi:hypothetical protein